MGRNDLAAMKAATAELEQASQAMAQHLYSQGRRGRHRPSRPGTGRQEGRRTT